MTSIASITSVGAGSYQAPVVSSAAKPSVSAEAPVATSAATSSNETARLVNDPAAKVIIQQYVNGNDDVVTQTPSKAVVAYLENGLTAEGFPKQSLQA